MERKRQPSKKFRHSQLDPSEYSNNPFIDDFHEGLSISSKLRSESLNLFTRDDENDTKYSTKNYDNRNGGEAAGFGGGFDSSMASSKLSRLAASRKDRDPLRYNTVCIVDNISHGK